MREIRAHRVLSGDQETRFTLGSVIWASSMPLRRSARHTAVGDVTRQALLGAQKTWHTLGMGHG